MRVLVTGACGWIGGHLTRGLSARGHDVTFYDLRCPRTEAPHYLGDIRDRVVVERAMRSGPDVVVHLAARYGRVWCESKQADAFDVNVAGTALIAEVCQEAGVPFVLASSSEVYGIRAGDPRGLRTEEERHDLRPLNTYGETKLMAEKAARRILDPDLLAIWRLNMPYGPGGRPGDSGVPGYGYNALHTWIWQAAHGLLLTVYRDTSRSWTWIGDVVDAMIMLLEVGHRGTINVCSSRDMQTSYDTAKTVLALAVGSTSTINEVDAPAGVTPWKQLDDRLLYDLGWEPSIDLTDGIGRTIGWMRDRFDKWGRWRDETTVAAHA